MKVTNYILTPFNMVTCKGIISRVDPVLNIEEPNEMIKSPFEVLDIKRFNRRKCIQEDQVEFISTGITYILGNDNT